MELELPDSIIKNNKVVIFSVKNCPFCTLSKQILEKHTTDYKEVLYKQSYYEWIVAKTGRSSFPAVFINGVYVGGCNDGGLGGILTLHNKGLLPDLLDDSIQ
jgi:glutaredoxin 3